MEAVHFVFFPLWAVDDELLFFVYAEDVPQHLVVVDTNGAHPAVDRFRR